LGMYAKLWGCYCDRGCYCDNRHRLPYRGIKRRFSGMAIEREKSRDDRSTARRDLQAASREFMMLWQEPLFHATLALLLRRLTTLWTPCAAGLDLRRTA
ncbi:hypothetical protein LJC09_05025, partial [Desulfovibrio sp. OttesenSCG-928-F20]|nr:hypothetical protein [Desulfovibrio sp. OttesenSCG-928-F20]